MGTHPIFESDFDCLTEAVAKLEEFLRIKSSSSSKYEKNMSVQHEPSSSDLYLNTQLIDKSVSCGPKVQASPDAHSAVASQLSDAQRAELSIIKRGHLGIPEDVMKAGAAQYATMCGGINNKFMMCKQETHGDPRACLKLNNAVSDCASEYFLNAINRCGSELFQYSQCLETDQYRRPGMCRGAQAAYDHCAFAKLGIDKSFWAAAPAPVTTGALPAKPLNPLQLRDTVANNDPSTGRGCFFHFSL